VTEEGDVPMTTYESSTALEGLMMRTPLLVRSTSGPARCSPTARS
jgi:hypothetical protein